MMGLISKVKKYLLVCLFMGVGGGLCWFSILQQEIPTGANRSMSDARMFRSNTSLASKPTVQPSGGDKRQLNKHPKREVGSPIVTMFTTIRDVHCRKAIHKRLINNWLALPPGLDPVLFVPFTEHNSSWISSAIANNWRVRFLYGLRKNLPILSAMFKEVLALSTTPFVGYANADLLFDASLISTLRLLSQRLNVSNEKILIVGRRRNVDTAAVNLGSGSDLTKISEMEKIGLHQDNAQDYFIISRQSVPWNEVPDFVVGRIGYDNWFVSKAQDWNMTLIDASRTILAVHQSGIDGFNSGWTTVSKESKYMNYWLVKNFSYKRGFTRFAPFYTKGECDLRPRLRYKLN
ncbi:hypothetical protein LSH36_396g06009 [Paralvinella palmiformis]|uniref:Uncharacterized protein n=1 Tax=Paralvinella palmiformis TaxID=53620 RepID=A0AAD9JD43_9ANNE|nr:hypothetical protein LSH36_396g06009 [Paralvinella palmiformis]